MIITPVGVMESRLSPSARSEPCLTTAANLPMIQSQTVKKHKSKGSKEKTKASQIDRLQPVLTSTCQTPMSELGDIDNPISIIAGSSTAIGVDDARKVELLREGYFKSKIRADEYLLLVAAEKESFSARGWMAGEDLYSFKAKSNEKKQQFHQANRLYYGLSTLLYASIGAMKANELDIYVRRKALLLPGNIFDISEWEPFLLLAKECRSKELKDESDSLSPMRYNQKLPDFSAKNQLRLVTRFSDSNLEILVETNKSQKTEENENLKLQLDKSLEECHKKTNRLREESLKLKYDMESSILESNKYIEKIALKIMTALKSVDTKSDDTKLVFGSVVQSIGTDNINLKLLIEKLEESKKQELLSLQEEFDEKCKSLRKGHEIELFEKEQQRIYLSNGNEALALIYDQKIEENKILQANIIELEVSRQILELKIIKIDEKEEERKLFDILKEIADDEEKEKNENNYRLLLEMIEKEKKLQEEEMSRKKIDPMLLNELELLNTTEMQNGDSRQSTHRQMEKKLIHIECQTDYIFEPPKLILSLPERIRRLENDLVLARAEQVQSNIVFYFISFFFTSKSKSRHTFFFFFFFSCKFNFLLLS